jgi:hypothetical protein
MRQTLLSYPKVSSSNLLPAKPFLPASLLACRAFRHFFSEEEKKPWEKCPQACRRNPAKEGDPCSLRSMCLTITMVDMLSFPVYDPVGSCFYIYPGISVIIGF